MTAEMYSFERYLNVRSAYGASFAPDGQRISFLTDITGVAEVWSVPVDTHATRPAWPEQLSFRGERVASAKFSPEGDTLVLTADTGGSELTQLYTLRGDGSTFKALTEQPDIIYSSPVWSPDGQRMAYMSNERDRRYFDVYERDLASGEIRCLLQQDGTNGPVAYSPDGKQLLVSRDETNIRNWLYLVDVATGETRLLTPDTGEKKAGYEFPRWTADGQGLYVLTTRGRQFMTLARIDIATTEMTYLRENKWDSEALAVSKDGTRMALVMNQDGYSKLELLDLAQGWQQRRALPSPMGKLPSGIMRELTWSKDGNRLAFTLDSANDASDVWVWDIEERALVRATESVTGGIPQSAFASPSLVRYPTFDGRQIPAFLYLPQSEGEQARNLPVVVYVHGGPEGQSRPMFNPVMQYLVSQGYGVFVPNVRGSTGYGYEYQSLDDVRLRMDSVKDLQYAARWLSERGIADPRRIAIMGGSYGGFMVLSAVTTYPEIWAAGVDIVGIANFVTFLENTGAWRRKNREAEYGSLENDREFLEQISPIRSVDRITAPLFVVHGANDPRVPVGEAEQIVAALRQRDVPVEYMRFADEGHGIIKRVNKLVVYPAIARFLDRYVRGV